MKRGIGFTIDERQRQYGDIAETASIDIALSEVMRETQGWEDLSDIQIHCLNQINVKIARILNQGQNHKDNWHDIQGYAKLVEDSL
jgi:UDP-N-acetylmuramoylalanine-D-glutamate ligase